MATVKGKRASVASVAGNSIVANCTVPGALQCYQCMHGPNGHYNFKRPLVALNKLYASGQVAGGSIVFGNGAPAQAAQAAQAWLAKPSAGATVLLVGYMVCYGWAVYANGLQLGQGAAQGRRSIAQVANTKAAQKVFAQVWAKPAATPNGPSAQGASAPTTGNGQGQGQGQ